MATTATPSISTTAISPPQFHPNTLTPIPVTRTALLSTLAALQTAVSQGVQLLQQHVVQDFGDDSIDAYGTIFKGHLGIAFTFLRLERQSTYLNPPTVSSSLSSTSVACQPDFLALARARIPLLSPHYGLTKQQHSPTTAPLNDAHLGASLLRIVTAVKTFSSLKSKTQTLDQEEAGHQNPATRAVSRTDIATLSTALDAAIAQPRKVEKYGHLMGTDEVLLGRAGVLWGALCLRTLFRDSTDWKAWDNNEVGLRQAIEGMLEKIPGLVEVIFRSGREGREDFEREFGKGDVEEWGLMWPWIDGFFGLGAVHGITSILTILLSCALEEISPHLPLIAQTITTLCVITNTHDGHLPLSVPPRPTSTIRTSPLVQLCHGTPGLLLLLGVARQHEAIVQGFWSEEWTAAAKRGGERVWEEGLLGKGGSLCHGIGGNGWALLEAGMGMRYRSGTEVGEKERVVGDALLGRGLAFLLEARDTLPYATTASDAERDGSEKMEEEAGGRVYRMPDSPYGLFEGLAGTVAAWAEGCVVVCARLRELELEEESSRIEGGENGRDEALERYLSDIVGIPGFGAGF